MSLSQTLQAFEALDSAHASGQTVVKLLESYPDVSVAVTKITGANGSTDFVRIVIPGSQGKRAGGSAPTLGIVGRLGGIGARPGRIGLVSDGDGAVAAVAAALKRAHMQAQGDVLAGDVIIARLIQHEVGHLDGELYIDGLERSVKKRALRQIRETL